MSPQDIAKDAIRIVTTAGLSKDDLLDKKVALLTNEIVTLAQNLAASEAENVDLKNKVTDLEQQLASLRPKGELHPDAIRFLKMLFEHGALPVTQIAAILRISKGMAEYHRDELLKAEMIVYPKVVRFGRIPELLIQAKGRAYLVECCHV
jgi:DNA-binding MarR family transcriptional regulator